MSDQKLLQLIQRDASAGLEEAIDCYGPAIQKICRSFLPEQDAETLEETVADCFVELWRNCGRFEVDRNVSLKSYFYGIARNVARNRRRQLAAQPETTSLEVLPEQGEDIVEMQAMINTDYAILMDCIKRFKSPEREIFVARFLEQKSMKEIAQELSLKEKTVENYLTRGKKKLRQELTGLGVMV